MKMQKSIEAMDAATEPNSSCDSLPSEEELFEQIKLTIDNAWKNDLSKRDIDKWLDNFTGKVFNIDYERQLALWLLANFVYYNEYEVRHLCKVLYRDFIHRMLSAADIEDPNSIRSSREQVCMTSKFYHLGKSGESGAFVLYYFRQANDLPITSFILHPERLEAHVNNVVFIDDVTISGSQAEKYLERETLQYDEQKTKILLTFFSTQQAKERLNNSGIEVISCTVLDERSKCFSDKSNIFHHYPNHLGNGKRFAFEYGKELYSAHPLGYQDGQYIFGFSYNTPDNTLPIFWTERKGWTPIIKRHEKNYGGVIEDAIERFI